MRRNLSLSCVAVFGVLGLVLWAGRLSAASYEITDLQGLAAYDINNSGQIVGVDPDLYPHTEAFVRSTDGVVQHIGMLPGGDSSYATCTSGANVAGATMDTNNMGRAFLYSGSGPMQDLGTLFGTRESNAASVSDSGQVVGDCYDNQYASHAFLYSGSGPMQRLGTFAGGKQSHATGINNNGQIAGYADTADGSWHAFVCAGTGALQDLGTLPGTTRSYANSINDSGQVVGVAYTPGGDERVFLYGGSGPLRYLGTLGGTQSYAEDINASGIIVGDSYTADGQRHAFLSDGGAMVDLNSLVDPASGWTLYGAFAINDAGQILSGAYNTAGVWQPVLLTPVPEPSTLAFLGTGAISVFAYAWRRRRSA